MSWGRDDPGFPPSPDPAAAAEEYFYQQSLMGGPDEPPWECETCRDRGFIVEGDHDPRCTVADGTQCQAMCPIEREYPCPDCGKKRYANGLAVVGFASEKGRVVSIDIRTESYDDHGLLTDEATRSRAIRRQHMPHWQSNDVAITAFDVRDPAPIAAIDEDEVPF